MDGIHDIERRRITVNRQLIKKRAAVCVLWVLCADFGRLSAAGNVVGQLLFGLKGGRGEALQVSVPT